MLTLAAAAPFVFRALEHVFGGGTGGTKMSLAMQVLKLIGNALATAGRDKPPTDNEDEFKKQIEEWLKIEKKKPDWQEAGKLYVGGKILRVRVEGIEE